MFRAYLRKNHRWVLQEREKQVMDVLKSILRIFSNLTKDEVARIIESGSDEDLENAYEERRLNGWLMAKMVMVRKLQT